jgi:hypothetical protein
MMANIDIVLEIELKIETELKINCNILLSFLRRQVIISLKTGISRYIEGCILPHTKLTSFL